MFSFVFFSFHLFLFFLTDMVCVLSPEADCSLVASVLLHYNKLTFIIVDGLADGVQRGLLSGGDDFFGLFFSLDNDESCDLEIDEFTILT